MAAYVKLTNFAVKDGLLSGNPLKVVTGSELDDEFNAIATSSQLNYTSLNNAIDASFIKWDFSTTTTMADPGSGIIRFNNATASSVTAIAIDDLNADGNDVSAYVVSWDDSTGSTNRGTLMLRQSTSVFAIYSVTGLTDNSGWTQLAVTYVTGSGSFVDGTETYVSFYRTGEASTDVSTVAGIAANVTTVAGIAANVTTVAGISGNVTTVAGNSANVTTVATDIANVNTVGGNIANVNTVAGVSGNVTTVAGISGNVTTVAGISGNVTTVAGISADVTSVASISSDVSAVAAQFIGWNFSTTTAMADPGSGVMRFNNATVSSVTAIAFDDNNSAAADVSNYVLTWDDATSTNKGTLTIRQGTANYAIFNVTGLTDNVGWTEVAVTHVSSSGSFANATLTFVDFDRTGDAGTGDVNGPGVSVDSELALFSGTGGKTIKRATTTGLLKATSGVIGAAVSGTDIKTVNGTSLLGSGDVAISSGISNVVTATTATTLTSTKTLLQITPASYGVTVKLPDATTCSVAADYHVIDNRGAYPVRIENNAGTLLGFVYGGVVSRIGCNSISTAAGTWSIENNELVGASAQLLTTSLTAITTAAGGCIALDANREIIIGNNSTTSLVAVVFNKSTNTFGSVTTVRTADVSNKYAAVSAGTDKILVVSSNQTTGMEAVVLSISGTTITVNTAATATLSANISAFADGCGLVSIPSVSGSFVTSYTVATPSAEIRAISVSGTTVTIGSATALDGTAGGLIAATGDKVIAVSYATTNVYTKPYTVSGSTLSAGTGTTTAAGLTVGNIIKFFALGSRWCVLYSDSGTVGTRGGIVSLAATTTTISALGSSLGAANGNLQDAIVVGSNKVLVVMGSTSNNANILTDSSGTASAGTAITVTSETARQCLFVTGTDVLIHEGTTNSYIQVIDCSGTSPVLTESLGRFSSSEYRVATSASNSILSRTADNLYGTATAHPCLNSSAGPPGRVDVVGKVIWQKFGAIYPFNSSTYRGKSDSERWTAITGSNKFVKLECAA